jgi:hypothetical protein
VNIERQLHVGRAKPPCSRSTPSAGTPAISASPRPCGGDGVEQGTAVAYDADAHVLQVFRRRRRGRRCRAPHAHALVKVEPLD